MLTRTLDTQLNRNLVFTRDVTEISYHLTIFTGELAIK